ncbi:hypothetical protein SOPP22_16460 [Shewanella sp. OPT22]|nr:hypothetical protein SOPP22_16460 [Shewanella sp. OPT22]
MRENEYKLKTEHCLKLMELLAIAFHRNEVEIDELKLDRFGRHDDFVYSEFLSREFEGLQLHEREALMFIAREVINASARAYNLTHQQHIEDNEERLLFLTIDDKHHLSS